MDPDETRAVDSLPLLGVVWVVTLFRRTTGQRSTQREDLPRIKRGQPEARAWLEDVPGGRPDVQPDFHPGEWADGAHEPDQGYHGLPLVLYQVRRRYLGK